MRRIVILIFLFILVKINAQNKQILYDFAGLPQTLLLNPALETNYKYHSGIPLISGISSRIGSSGLVMTDLFAIDGININDKISRISNLLTVRDFVEFNTQIEVLNAGFRINKKIYLNFGFYEEVDAIGYYPKDLFVLFNEGNAFNLNRIFSISQLKYKIDILGVLHFGVSKKINEKLNLGARVKLYSSAINLQSNNNTGTFTTVQGNNSIYQHFFSNVDVNVRTAGLIDNEEYIEDVNTHFKNTFFGSNSNLGFGIDAGITYQFNRQLKFTASILDLGFINYKNNIKNTRIKGDFVFEGVELQFDPNSTINYWGQIDQRIKDELPTTEDEESYIAWRPTKINASLKYSFGEQRRLLCFDDTYRDYYTNALGVQLYTIFRPLSPQLALTSFYELALSKKTRTKMTYTIDDFSYSNIGFGFSTQVSKLNFYAMVDNLLEFSNLSSANSISFQFGFNLIFN